MSLALYRKYRPGSFAEVKGQEHVTAPLQQALRNGRVHHAFLFSGPRGCGKTSSARILARSLNCEQGPTPDPCGVCDSCVALAPNGPGSLDVVEIDAASHGGVDDARDLRERAFYAPISSKYKIYIIDEAHMVSREGFNALLKLVEEPPDFLRFVFATTEPEKVLATIRSRTHHYPFRLIPRRELTDLLTGIIEQEGIAVDPSVLPLVVRAAAGSARDGLSILDQVLSSAGSEGVTRETAAALLGVTPDTLLDDVIDAFAVRDGAAVFGAVDSVMESGHDPRRFAADVLERLRDLIVLDAIPEAGDKGLLDCPPGQLVTMGRQAGALGTAGLSRTADLFHAGLTEMRGTTSPRLLLELVCARVLLPSASSADGAVLSRLERLERRFDISGGAVPAVPPHVPGPHHEPHPAPDHSATPAPAPAGTPAPAPAPRRDVEASPGHVSSLSGGLRPASSAASGADPDPQPGQPVGQPARGPAAAPSGRAWPTAAMPGGGAPPPAAAPQPPAARPPAAAASPDQPPPAGQPPASEGPAGGLDATALRRAWDDVMENVKKLKRSTWVALMDAQVQSVEGRTLTLAFTRAGNQRAFASGANPDYLKDALRAVLGSDFEILGVVAGESPPPPAGAPAAAPAVSAYDGFAPGDEAEAEDPDLPRPERVVGGEDAALRLVADQLGGTVVGTLEP